MAPEVTTRPAENTTKPPVRKPPDTYSNRPRRNIRKPVRFRDVN